MSKKRTARTVLKPGESIPKAISDVLTPEEIENVKKEFAVFDKDKNGSIDLNEFVKEEKRAAEGSFLERFLDTETLTDFFKGVCQSFLNFICI
jgi:Ca2+-binding EF-hand superfamily protein